MSSRQAGLLLHPTSLPGEYGIGDLGPTSTRFLDWAAESGVTVWQVLPLGPTSGGHAPYNSPSAFAGNPLLISPECLVGSGLLKSDELQAAGLPPGPVDYPRVVESRARLLRLAWNRFDRAAPADLMREYERFVEHADQGPWLQDWALFAAIKRRHNERAWPEWDEELRRRRPEGLQRVTMELAGEIAFHRFLQFLFFRQWAAVRQAADTRGISILGDLPFYVAADSADVWSHPELFQLGPDSRPRVVAGVPPDYFSEDGQLWGNPIFDWERMAGDGYSWWIERLRANLRLADRVRLDHFRAFESFWEVPAGHGTARGGRWVPGPGHALFDAIRSRLPGELPLIAEDLGLITDAVRRLLDRERLPGMRILQFAFGEGDDPRHDPAHYPPDCVAYTGTHDNPPLSGWFDELEVSLRERVLARLQATPDTLVPRAIETVFGSTANLAIVPLQDVLRLGDAARMNRPGEPEGNWRWRAEEGCLSLRLCSELRALVTRTGRQA